MNVKASTGIRNSGATLTNMNQQLLELEVPSRSFEKLNCANISTKRETRLAMVEAIDPSSGRLRDLQAKPAKEVGTEDVQ